MKKNGYTPDSLSELVSNCVTKLVSDWVKDKQNQRAALHPKMA